MTLRLRVVSIHAQLLGEDGIKVFGVHGGSIGRSGDNDWVLPDADRYVSGHHARVEYRDGKYWLTDTSSNGTYVNDSNSPLADSGPHALKEGDRLRLGDYELTVDLDVAGKAPADKSRQIENDLGEALDLGSLLSTESSSGRRIAPVNAYGQAVEFPSISSGNSLLEPPPRAPRRAKKVADSKGDVPWNLSTRRKAEPYRNPAKSPEPQPQPASVAATDSMVDEVAPGTDPLEGLNALCRGAGIDPSSIPVAVQPQAVQIAGQILREVSMGLMELTQERNELKKRFRISQDTIQPSDNNPLKFSAGVEEAIRKLFEEYGNRYLGPVESLRESFRDTRLHHQAIAGAMQAAFIDFIRRLDPTDLRERFDRGLKRGGLLGAANKMKYWDLYSELYQNLAQMPKDELPHVFVEEFARAYEAKIKELAARRGNGADKRPESRPSVASTH